MTLDEAIKHCEEVAEERRNDYERACAYNIPSEGCLKCAEEHRQLAEWLKELKRLKEQEPCEDWHDVPSDEMTLEQARQAVKDLRKKLMEYLWQEPCEDCISRADAKKYLSAPNKNGDRVIYESDLDLLPPVTPQQTRWTPCSERMPKEEKQTYWICTNNGYQCECRWTNVNPFWTDLTTDWHWHIADVPQYNKVVAWMPLPEPYKVESEDEE